MRKALISQGFSVWHLNRPQHLVGAGGFEPPKAVPTDLQSAPFGHSGTLPYSVKTLELVDGRNLFSKVCRACGIATSHFAVKNITP